MPASRRHMRSTWRALMLMFIGRFSTRRETSHAFGNSSEPKYSGIGKYRPTSMPCSHSCLRMAGRSSQARTPLLWRDAPSSNGRVARNPTGAAVRLGQIRAMATSRSCGLRSACHNSPRAIVGWNACRPRASSRSYLAVSFVEPPADRNKRAKSEVARPCTRAWPVFWPRRGGFYPP